MAREVMSGENPKGDKALMDAINIGAGLAAGVRDLDTLTGTEAQRAEAATEQTKMRKVALALDAAFYGIKRFVKFEPKPIAAGELHRLKLAYADAKILVDSTDSENERYDANWDAFFAAEKALLNAARCPIIPAPVPVVSLGQGDYAKHIMAEDLIDPARRAPLDDAAKWKKAREQIPGYGQAHAERCAKLDRRDERGEHRRG